MDASAKALSRVIPNEVAIDVDGNERILAKGQRNRTISFSKLSQFELLELFEDIHEAAFWIYESYNDADAKHAIYNYHLSGEWPQDKTWPDITALKSVLSNTEEAYRLHLYDSSKELLKAQTELRRALHDEISWVNKSTATLVTNLWRDFAIAAGVAAIKFMNSTSQTLSDIGIQVLSAATSLFTILSLCTTLYSNRRFHRIFADTRHAWRTKLYGFIQDQDFEKLVVVPISQGLREYCRVAILTSMIYFVISVYLLYAGFPSLFTPIKDRWTAIKNCCLSPLEDLVYFSFFLNPPTPLN
jgi:hypothetical protein